MFQSVLGERKSPVWAASFAILGSNCEKKEQKRILLVAEQNKPKKKNSWKICQFDLFLLSTSRDARVVGHITIT